MTVRTAACLAIALAAALPAAAQEVDPFVYDLSVPQGLTRAEVRAEFEAARLAGVLPQPGEAGDTDEVLLARAEFERLSAQVRLAERAEQPSPAMREAEVAMAEAIGEDELLALEFLELLEEEPVVEGMAIEVIDVYGAPVDDEPLPAPAPVDAAMLPAERRD